MIPTRKALIMPVGALVALGSLSSAVASGQPASGPLQFERDIRPMFSENCFTCHGPDEILRERGLRLDEIDGLFVDRGRFGGAVVVAGDPETSILYQRITAKDARKRMPRRGSGFTLTPDEIETIRTWIQEGAAPLQP